MKQVLLHNFTGKNLLNLNYKINKTDIQAKTTADCMNELLYHLELDQGKYFSLSAYMDHVDAITNPEGKPATTSLWLTQQKCICQDSEQ